MTLDLGHMGMWKVLKAELLGNDEKWHEFDLPDIVFHFSKPYYSIDRCFDTDDECYLYCHGFGRLVRMETICRLRLKAASR